MHRLRPSRANAAIALAALAFFVALGGPAEAAKLINGSSLKNRSVAGKKLKRNTLGGTEINESKLGRVPRAAKADLATNATNATNAANAAHAANADTVGGLAPNALLRAATGHNGGDQFFGATGDKTWTSATITAPTAGFLLVNISGYTFDTAASNPIIQHHITLDGEVLNNAVTLASSTDVVNTSPREAISGTRLIPVTAGPHTVNFIGHIQTGANPTQYSVSRATITALFVPFSGTGTTTATLTRPRAAQSSHDSAR